MMYETLKSFKQIYFLKIGKISVQQNNKATKHVKPRSWGLYAVQFNGV